MLSKSSPGAQGFCRKLSLLDQSFKLAWNWIRSSFSADYWSNLAQKLGSLVELMMWRPYVVRRLSAMMQEYGSSGSVVIATAVFMEKNGAVSYRSRFIMTGPPRIGISEGAIRLRDIEVHWETYAGTNTPVSSGSALTDLTVVCDRIIIDPRAVHNDAHPGISSAGTLKLKTGRPAKLKWKTRLREDRKHNARPSHANMGLERALHLTISEIPLQEVKWQAMAIIGDPIDSRTRAKVVRRQLASILHPDRCRAFDSTPLIARANALLDDAEQRWA